MDPRLGIDTSGPGEAVFAIRFIGKPQFLWKIRNFRTRKKFEKILKIPIRTYFLDELEMSSVYIHTVHRKKCFQSKPKFPDKENI